MEFLLGYLDFILKSALSFWCMIFDYVMLLRSPYDAVIECIFYYESFVLIEFMHSMLFVEDTFDINLS